MDLLDAGQEDLVAVDLGGQVLDFVLAHFTLFVNLALSHSAGSTS